MIVVALAPFAFLWYWVVMPLYRLGRFLVTRKQRYC